MSSGYTDSTRTDKRIGQAWRRPVCHMFLLCGARPYVSIVWRSAICFYCLALCSCGPYVSIVWRSAICFYCVALGHMFLLCVCGPYVFIGDCYESYHMFSLTMEPSDGHVIKYYKDVLDIR